MTSETYRLHYLAAGRRARVSTPPRRVLDRAWPVLVAVLAGLAILTAVGLTSLARVSAAPSRLLGDAAPAGLRDVRYSSSEWFGLVPSPSYYLRFKADFNEVTQMIARGGFESQPPSHGWNGPRWWEPSRPWPLLLHFRRSGECAVERVWWDPQTGEVLYLRFCP